MADKVLLVVLTEILISKVSSSFREPYSASPYGVSDPRPKIPFAPDYQLYIPSYIPNAAQKPYHRPAEVPKPLKRPLPSIRRPPTFSPLLISPTIHPSTELRPQSFQKSMEFIPSANQRFPTQQNGLELTTPAAQSPIEYRQSAYPKVSDTTPINLPIEFQQPTYQNAAELLSQPLQTPIEYHQPAYHNVAEFLPSQRPMEFQKHCLTSSDLTASKPTSTQIPLLTPSALKSLQALTSPTCECSSQLPMLSSQTIEAIKSLGLSKSECSKSDTLDTSVLNNLAIALQLLIVNNIINHPKPEPAESSSNLADSLLELAYPSEVGSSYSCNTQSPCQMHNAKFLGSSNFGDDGIMNKGMLGLSSLGSGLSSPRPGLNLMSPYDAIASSVSPFESTPSLFTLKNSFQSPYAAMIAEDNNKDLFTMSDLF